MVAVPTVPSYYCTDLVSPMNQLLAVALGSEVGPTNPLDKFAFISDSTLPAKPFAHVYQTLAVREGSDFCVFPSNEWADIADYTTGGKEMAVKSHQWITLGRSHAEQASKMWAAGNSHDFMTRYQMNTQAYGGADNLFADSRNFGCLDEFWYMAALYGPIRTTGAFEAKEMPSFTGSPLIVASTSAWQGMCDTFVQWSQYVPSVAGGNSAFDRFFASLDAMSVPNPGNKARPGWWDKISSHGIAAIRGSDFLFVRKFIDGPHLVDSTAGVDFHSTYSSLVFGITR
jgi:hypothetical protein